MHCAVAKPTKYITTSCNLIHLTVAYSTKYDNLQQSLCVIMRNKCKFLSPIKICGGIKLKHNLQSIIYC